MHFLPCLRQLPFVEKEDPFELQKQIVQGQLKLQRDIIDPVARDLLNQVLHIDPNTRISI